MIVGRKSGWWAAVMGLLAVCLIGLAFLQYRWIGQISQSEEQRMQNSLRLATAGFSRDFDSNITRLYSELQTRRDAAAGPVEDEYARRFMDWSATSADRGMVRAFYLIQRGRGATIQLSRLDSQKGTFEQIAWPIRFQALEGRLEAELKPDRPRTFSFSKAIDRDIPAVVAPIFRPPPESRDGDEPPPPGGFFRRPSISGWAMAELDLDWISRQLLPELVERHFAGAAGLDYQVGVVDADNPSRLIFRSDPKLTAAYFASADAVAGLFDVRPEFLLIRRMERTGPRRESRFGTERSRRRVFSAGLVPSSAAWQLRVRHVSGSLEAAVANARHRNLAVSFAGLLLVAATVVMLVLSARRAQRLAELQIEFVAGVSHELRTPLSVICSASDNLADGLIAEPTQVRRYGAVIRKEGRRLGNMVDQILAFAAARAGRQKYNFQRVRVPEIIDRALEACGPDLSDTGCEVEKSVPPDLPTVVADPISLMHCVRNLVSNAFHYGKEGRWIGVTAEVTAAPKGQELCISVRDRGPGIESTELPHIFEPFYRGSKAVAAQIRGAGLGLSLVRRIIEGHAGAVTVTSIVGQGSCFTLHLPLHPDTRAAASK